MRHNLHSSRIPQMIIQGDPVKACCSSLLVWEIIHGNWLVFGLNVSFGHDLHEFVRGKKRYLMIVKIWRVSTRVLLVTCWICITTSFYHDNQFRNHILWTQQDYAENSVKSDEYTNIFFALAVSFAAPLNVFPNEASDDRFKVSAAFRTWNSCFRVWGQTDFWFSVNFMSCIMLRFHIPDFLIDLSVFWCNAWLEWLCWSTSLGLSNVRCD